MKFRRVSSTLELKISHQDLWLCLVYSTFQLYNGVTTHRQKCYSNSRWIANTLKIINELVKTLQRHTVKRSELTQSSCGNIFKLFLTNRLEYFYAIWFKTIHFKRELHLNYAIFVLQTIIELTMKKSLIMLNFQIAKSQLVDAKQRSCDKQCQW